MDYISDADQTGSSEDLRLYDGHGVASKQFPMLTIGAQPPREARSAER